MVNRLSREDKVLIEQAVKEAEKLTDADFAVVIARASDEYRFAALICGLTVGSLGALLLWHMRIVTAFPALLMVELAACALMLGVPWLRHGCMRFEPKRFLHRRAAERAMVEYVTLTHRLPLGVPFALLYISLGERYVHIFTSRAVREKIPDSAWDAAVNALTGHMHEGLAAAILKAVRQGEAMLKASFPYTGRKHSLTGVREG